MNINNKVIQKKLYNDILDMHDGDKQLIKNNIHAGREREHDPVIIKARDYVKNGGLLIYNSDILSYLNSLGLRTKRYKADPFEYYAVQMARVLQRIYYEAIREGKK